MLGYVAWDESVAVSNLAAAVLEERLGYGNVELRKAAGPENAISGVASGDLDAFQAVWTPAHGKYLRRNGDRVKLLGSWLFGTTRASLAAPRYMGISSVDRLSTTGVQRALIPEPTAAAMAAELPPEALSRLGLRNVQTYRSSGAMFGALDRLYREKKPFVFLAWSPSWMNLEYDFRYLEDPDGVLGSLTRPDRLRTAVRPDLETEDPLAYALLDEITLTDYQTSSLELAIRDAESPAKGAETWMKDHRKLVKEWTKAAKRRADE